MHVLATSALESNTSTTTTTSITFHPFESLSLATRAVLYTLGLLLGLGCVIASCGCCCGGCMILYRRKHQRLNFSENHLENMNHGISASSSFSFTNHAAIAQSGQDIAGQHFAQESGDTPMPRPPQPPPSRPPVPPMRLVPGKGGNASGRCDSIRSVPEETINASNKMASTVHHSYTLDGLVYYQSSV